MAGKMTRGGTMSDHTPGPWEIVWESDADHSGPRRAASVGPVEPIHDHWSGYTICDEKDARLTAAAPELLAALRESLANDLDDFSREQARERARDAIAKAEGRA